MHVTGVAAQAADKAVPQKLMPVAVALDADGKPTPALLKKLAALGADASVVPTLKRAAGRQGRGAVPRQHGRAARRWPTGLQKALDEALAKLPIPKVMTYQLADGWSSVNFVRPAHGLVALHGADVVPVSALGLTAGRETQATASRPPIDPVVLQRCRQLRRAAATSEGAVIASFAERRAEIVRQLQAAARAARA